MLKIEWVVTSLGREAVPSKVGVLWDDLRRFETEHEPELARLSPQAWSARIGIARSLS